MFCHLARLINICCCCGVAPCMKLAILCALRWLMHIGGFIRQNVERQFKIKKIRHTLTSYCTVRYLRYRPRYFPIPIFRTPLDARRPSVATGPSDRHHRSMTSLKRVVTSSLLCIRRINAPSLSTIPRIQCAVSRIFLDQELIRYRYSSCCSVNQ